MTSALLSSVVVASAIIYCTLSEARIIGDFGGTTAVPPPFTDTPLMARYIMHNTNWLSVATISTQGSIKGYPFVSLKSLSDGPVDNSTGIPYLYMTDLAATTKDTLVDNKVTVMATLAQTDYCDINNFDPQDPRCAKVIISGNLVKVDNSTPEYKFGQESLFGRHPAMKYWPTEHGFYVTKVDMKQILVVDYFGGMKTVTLDDYFSANASNLINLDTYMRKTAKGRS